MINLILNEGDIIVPLMPPFEGEPCVCEITKVIRNSKLDLPPSRVICKLVGDGTGSEFSWSYDSVRLATPHEIAECKLILREQNDD